MPRVDTTKAIAKSKEWEERARLAIADGEPIARAYAMLGCLAVMFLYFCTLLLAFWIGRNTG